MKQFAILIIFGLLATESQARVTCEECIEAMGVLRDTLQEDEWVLIQVNLLVDSICPFVEDAEVCKSYFSTYWGQIARVMYPQLIEPTDVCTILQACGAQKDALRVWTCSECEFGLTMLSQTMVNEETVLDVIELLSGDAFCGQLLPDVPEYICTADITTLMPEALPVIAGFISNNAGQLCNIGVAPDLCPV